MKVTDQSAISRVEQRRQQDWVDRNLLKFGYGPKSDTWDAIKFLSRPAKVAWAPH